MSIAQMLMGVTEHHGFFCSLILSFMTCDFHPHDFMVVAHTLGRKDVRGGKMRKCQYQENRSFSQNSSMDFCLCFVGQNWVI